MRPKALIAAIVAVLALMGISIAGVSYWDARQYAEDQVDSMKDAAGKKARYDTRVKGMADLPEDGSQRDTPGGEVMKPVPPSEWGR